MYQDDGDDDDDAWPSYCSRGSVFSWSFETSIRGMEMRVEDSGVSVSDSAALAFSEESFSVEVLFVEELSSPESYSGGEGDLAGGSGDFALCVSSLTATLSSELAGLPFTGLFIITESSEYGTGDGDSESSWLMLLRSDTDRELRELACE